jgi:hypothetical protein
VPIFNVASHRTSRAAEHPHQQAGKLLALERRQSPRPASQLIEGVLSVQRERAAQQARRCTARSRTLRRQQHRTRGSRTVRFAGPTEERSGSEERDMFCSDIDHCHSPRAWRGGRHQVIGDRLRGHGARARRAPSAAESSASALSRGRKLQAELNPKRATESPDRPLDDRPMCSNHQRWKEVRTTQRTLSPFTCSTAGP